LLLKGPGGANGKLSFYDNSGKCEPTFYNSLTVDNSYYSLEFIPRPLSLGLATGKRRVHDRSAWGLLVTTATRWQAPEW